MLLASALAACASSNPDYRNVPLADGASNKPVASPVEADPNAPIIMIAFSGGGSRAAALGLGVLDQLKAVTYPAGGVQRPLVDQVKIVSSVSGGSVVAGWFGLVGPARMDEMKDKFLALDNTSTLVSQAADPITWFRLTFSDFTRIDALSNLLDRELFQNAKFADLRRPGAPFTMLNATDMESGESFAFTPQRFDDICSDLDQLPLSVGVSASAAFPVAFSPASLRNYSYEGCKGAVPPAGWIQADLSLPLPRYINLEEFKRARYANALRNGPDAFRNEHYLHLLDGGLADNQGVHSLSDALVSPHSQTQILDAINLGKAKRIVVIAVNARSDSDSGIGAQQTEPGLIQTLGIVIGTPIDATTAYANASLDTLIDQLKSAGGSATAAPGKALFAGLRVYNVPIDFDQFGPEQKALETTLKNIGTSWTLTPQQLQQTLDAGKLLLTQHPCFQRLLVDLNAPGAAASYPTAKQSCPFADDPRAAG